MDSSYVHSNCIYWLGSAMWKLLRFYELHTFFWRSSLLKTLCRICLLQYYPFRFFAICTKHFFFLSVSKFQLKFCICILYNEFLRKKFPIWSLHDFYIKTNHWSTLLIQILSIPINDFESGLDLLRKVKSRSFK